MGLGGLEITWLVRNKTIIGLKYLLLTHTPQELTVRNKTIIGLK